MTADSDELGIELPRSRDEAGTRLMRLTRQGEAPVFWIARRKGLLSGDHRPEGTRAWPDVAAVVLTEALMAVGQVELRYKDGFRMRVLLEEVGHGRILMPAEVCEKWVACEDGYIDLRGRKHGSDCEPEEG